MDLPRCRFPSFSLSKMIMIPALTVCILMIYVYTSASKLPLLQQTTTTTTSEVSVNEECNETMIKCLLTAVDKLKYDVMMLKEENQKMKTDIAIATTTISSLQKQQKSAILNDTITAEEDKIQTTILQVLDKDLFYPDSALPYIGADIWDEVVDHNHSFYLRSYDYNFPNAEAIRMWIASKPRPISIVINNHKDLPWPYDRNNGDGFNELLAEPNLHRLYISNPNEQDTSDKNSKVKPLPVGLQFNVGGKNTLYSEAKQPFHDVYSKVSKSPNESKALFLSPNRTNTVYVRPMGDTNHMSQFYDRNNDALKTWRSNIYAIINRTAPKSTHITMEFLDRKDYFDQLLIHRFVLSPAGNGIDCHGTWEALLAGCIPIVPISGIIPMFENLPVWFVSSWEEVTDDILEEKAKEMLSKIDKYNFEKVFADWWKHEINNVGW